MLVGHLFGCRLNMLFVSSSFFLRGCPGRNSSRAAIEAGASHRAVVDHSSVDVSVVDHGRIDVDYCGVIREVSAPPRAADESNSAITETVIHAPVEPNVRAPITGMKSINA